MARDQSLSVSPTKISGACGRLMCCLAYERDYYMEVAKQLPKIGAKVVTPYGDAVVTKIDIFAQAVTVEDENKNEMRFTLDQIRKMGLGGRPARSPKRAEEAHEEDTPESDGEDDRESGVEGADPQ
jgi:hypothetical protein